MGISTDAYLSYGCYLGEPEEDFGDLPWDDDTKWEGDYKDWWLWTEHNIDTCNPPSSVDNLAIEHKIPFTLLNAQHISFPMYILAIPSSIHLAERGRPKMLIELNSPSNTEKQALVDFYNKHLSSYTHKTISLKDLSWWLSSYSDF